MNKQITDLTHVAGRIMLALIFVLSGFGKLTSAAATMGYMQAMGVPTLLFWPTVALELLGGLAIIVGFQTRLAALALAGFCVVSGALFHSNVADQMQMIMLLKNIAMAGGLLLLVSSGSTALALDTARAKHRD
ncbi:MAG: DoxX family protein [Pseudomonadota bacterium]